MEEDKIFMVNGVTFKMIAVQGGTYSMGAADEDPEADDWEKPAHSETVADFMIGETQVTQELWRAVLGKKSYKFTSDLQCPIRSVSWIDCQTFIQTLNYMTGQKFRMPSEVEWKYAARGGNQNKGYKNAGSKDADAVTRHDANNEDEIHPVKTNQPNELGIYDMSGKVWEWREDYWRNDYESKDDYGRHILRLVSSIFNGCKMRESNRDNIDRRVKIECSSLRLAL